MKLRISSLLTILLFLAVASYLIFEPQLTKELESSKAFVLTDLKMSDFRGNTATIAKGYRGYFVFYSPFVDCLTCIRRLAEAKRLPKAFPDVGYFSILRGEEGRQHFADLLSEYEIPGEVLIDGQQRLATRLNLSKHPYLLIFDREIRLITSLPLDIEQPELEKQLYRYLDEI